MFLIYFKFNDMIDDIVGLVIIYLLNSSNRDDITTKLKDTKVFTYKTHQFPSI